MRARNLGALDDALTRAEEAAHTLPRERLPSLDAEVELELGRVRLELGDMALALEHARFSAVLAGDDNNRELEARAAWLDSTALYYLGDVARASVRAQKAVRLAGSGTDATTTDGRAAVLELALATQGYPAAAVIMREAAELGWRAQRRSEHARAARAFRLAAEAAIIRHETALALDWSQRALTELDKVGASRLIRPRIFATAGRAWLAAGQRESGGRLVATARSEVMAVALAIADEVAREKWMSHPDQKAILGLPTAAVEAERPRSGIRRRSVDTGEVMRNAVLLAPMRT